MLTKETIISTLAETRAKVLARYEAFTQEELERPCTQSEAPDGAPWRSKDHLAHFALVERAFYGMVQRTLKGSDDPVSFSRTGAKNREEVLAWIHRNNQAYVDAHRDDTLQMLLNELSDARRTTLSLLAELTDEQLKQPIPGAPWGDGTIGGVLATNAQHELQHLGWVEAGLRQNV